MEDPRPKRSVPLPETQEKPQNVSETYRYAADRIIEEAMARGEFDNLPGQGQPLDLRETDAERKGLWAMQRILENSDFSPDWVADRHEIDALVEAARQALQRSWNWRQAALARGEGYALVADQWDAALSRFREAGEKVNKRIRDYNLKAPHMSLHLRVLDLPAEIEAVKRES
jgi:hypothetical protein